MGTDTLYIFSHSKLGARSENVVRGGAIASDKRKKVGGKKNLPQLGGVKRARMSLGASDIHVVVGILVRDIEEESGRGSAGRKIFG